MKTLLFTLEFPPFKGGIANYYGNLAKHWPAGGGLAVLDNRKGELMSGRALFPWRRAFTALSQRLRADQGQGIDIDYVLVGQILPLGTVAWLLSYFRPFRYAVFLHGLDFNAAMKSRRKRFLAGLILRRADKILCANNYVAVLAAAFYPAGRAKMKVVNPGVAGLETVAPVPSAPAAVSAARPPAVTKPPVKYDLDGREVLLSVGRLVKRKGFDMTIAAIAEMTEAERKNLLYFIAGSGPDEAYLKSLVPAGLQDKIIFLGGVSEADKWSWLERADIFVMPARDMDGDIEGFGIVYLEANLAGKPVIAGASGGVRDAVTDGDNGLLVDPENVDSIKTAIIRLAADADLRAQLGRRGQERAKREFNWPQQSRKIADIINLD
jgi:phosphatidylinositol alpha-1,6-mannosyltransferase